MIAYLQTGDKRRAADRLSCALQLEPLNQESLDMRQDSYLGGVEG